MSMVSVSDIGILADDLTGACDVAACFSRKTGKVKAYVVPERNMGFRKMLVVVNTQSRLKSVEECKRLVRKVGSKLRKKPVLFKKIDTALRGNVGAELEALSEAVGSREILVAPAIPSIGRTTRNGIQYDDGVPISETAFAEDPVSPGRTSKIWEILHQTGNVECRIIDAESDEDLRRIVDMGLEKGRVIFVGSLGLANALAEKVEGDVLKEEMLPVSKNIYIVCGSMYERSRVQIEEAIGFYKHNAILIDATPEELSSCFRSHKIEEGIAIIRLLPLFSKSGASSSAELLSAFCKALALFIMQKKPDAIGIIGGETAFHLFRRLHISKLSVLGRVSDVMPFGTIENGELEGRLFATKGGSVGSHDAVVKTIQFFQGERWGG